MTTRQTRPVATIKNGTVIDHIAAGQSLNIVHLLQIDARSVRITLGLNYSSSILENKDFIKIEGHELTPEEANQVAILAPEATISIVRDEKVVQKFRVAMPEIIEGIIVCPNHNCISNSEAMDTAFNVQQRGHEVRLLCRYCQKTFFQNEIKQYRTEAKGIRR